jgi:ubiquitin C-terminal hydrolase
MKKKHIKSLPVKMILNLQELKIFEIYPDSLDLSQTYNSTNDDNIDDISIMDIFFFQLRIK